MSALGHKQTFCAAIVKGIKACPLRAIADIPLHKRKHVYLCDQY